MDLRFPGRTTTLDQLGPGACFLDFGAGAPGIGLVVIHRGRRHALILNSPHADGIHLSLVREDSFDADVLKLVGAALVPSLVIADFAFGRAGEGSSPPALHLGDGSAYLCGRTADGQIATFDVASGAETAVNIAYLPRSTRWRVAVPDVDGRLGTVFQAGVA